MAYLGKGTKSIDHATISTHTMTGDGSDTTMSITLGTTSVNNVSVFIGGVQQRPGQDYNVANDVITFTTAPAASLPVLAFVRKDTKKGTIADASVGLDTIKDGAVTDAKIIGLSASKLTGALSALDGSALTGISAVATSASDPAIDTNSTLGAVWINKTSGETYVCTDATTDANVWTNVGGGSGRIPELYVYQGTISGYASGGIGRTRTIDKFSLVTATANATDVGDLSDDYENSAGISGKTHGYIACGVKAPATYLKRVDKFSFASDGDGSNICDMHTEINACCGSGGDTHGYVSGGHGAGASAQTDQIQKFNISTEATGTDVGNLTEARYYVSSSQSETHGFTNGGYSGGHKNKIDKFTYASDNDATDHGVLSTARGLSFGCSSTTHGYHAGGYVNYNMIDKYAFASNTTGTNIGQLTRSGQMNGGSSSTTHGYGAGGYSDGNTNIIDRWSFSSDGHAVDVGDLTVACRYNAGQQT